MAKKYTYSIIGNNRVCDNTGEVKAVKLGERWFDICGTSSYSTDFFGNDETAIYEVYGRPSMNKVKIWCAWCNWARQNNAQLMIASHNCNYFSISGYIIDNDGTRYNLFITYANNYCSIVM